MNDNKKSINKENNSDDKGKLAEMNDSSAANKKTTTGVAEDKGTFGEMNGDKDSE